jgi:hypothetical protein
MGELLMLSLSFTTAAAIRSAVAVLGFAAMAGNAAAQLPQERHRWRVRVAIPDTFPLPDARALIVRYASDDRPDVIVLNPTAATPDALAAALALLHDLYKERPAAPGRYLVATLKGFAPLGDPNPATLRRLASQLSALRAQPPSRIGNVGRGRWIELTSPSWRS